MWSAVILLNDPGPILIAVLLVSFLGFLSWGGWHYFKQHNHSAHPGWSDTILFGLLLFAAFVLGIVLTYFAFYAIPGG